MGAQPLALLRRDVDDVLKHFVGRLAKGAQTMNLLRCSHRSLL